MFTSYYPYESTSLRHNQYYLQKKYSFRQITTQQLPRWYYDESRATEINIKKIQTGMGRKGKIRWKIKQ